MPDKQLIADIVAMEITANDFGYVCMYVGMYVCIYMHSCWKGGGKE